MTSRPSPVCRKTLISTPSGNPVTPMNRALPVSLMARSAGSVSLMI